MQEPNVPAPVTMTFFDNCPGKFICIWHLDALRREPPLFRHPSNPSIGVDRKVDAKKGVQAKRQSSARNISKDVVHLAKAALS